MKLRPHPLALRAITSLLALAILLAPASTALAAEEPARPANTVPAATKAKQADTSAADRRKANSDYEREKLDPDAFGAGASDESGEKEAAKDSGSSGSMLRFAFGLLVVLATIYGVHWLLKRWGDGKLQGVAGTAGIIDVVATTPLAQGRALHLVRVGDELVLVGATDQSITRIGEMDATRVSQLAGDYGKGEFQSMLNGAMVSSQPGVPAGMGGTASANEPFLKRFLDNLRLSTAR